MHINFGKHEFKTIPIVVFRNPDYVEWMRQQVHQTGPLAKAVQDAMSLIADFDRRPFAATHTCMGCSRPATYCTAYGDGEDLWPWCDTCDPYSYHAFSGKLHVIRTYADALHHVNWNCRGRKGHLKKLIRSLGETKGLPTPLTERRARRFFDERLNDQPHNNAA